jgi:hypothetical protein
MRIRHQCQHFEHLPPGNRELRSARGGLASFGAGNSGFVRRVNLASFGALPNLPMASFGAAPGSLASFGALPIFSMASFGAAKTGFVRRQTAAYDARPAQISQTANGFVRRRGTGFVRRGENWLRSARGELASFGAPG